MASFGILPDFKDNHRRTNSLAFAKIDCHTCQTLNQSCDRQRPRCGTCRGQKRKCGGFAMELVWKDAASPKSTVYTTGSDHDASHRNVARPPNERHVFKFVEARPKRTRKAKNSWRKNTSSLPSHEPEHRPFIVTTISDLSESELDQAPTLSSELQYNSPSPVDSQISNVVLDQHQDLIATNDLPFDLTLSCETLPGFDVSSAYLQNMSMMVDEHPDNVPLAGEDTHCASTLDASRLEDEMSLPRPASPTSSIIEVRYQDLGHKYSGVLLMYDEEFCVLPLSGDCRTNPFRLRRSHHMSQYLLHAVMAISSHHLSRKNDSLSMAIKMQKHRSAAIQLFSSALSETNFTSLLDTLLILIELEITQSASSLWGVHLNGARKLLEQADAVVKMREDPRTRAQIAMIVWWDVTIAFVSRRAPRLPMTYLEMLKEPNENDGWCFFSLNGCPDVFVLAMARLAKLAFIYEKTTEMEWTIFNRYPVDIIFGEVKSFINVEDADYEDALSSTEDVEKKRYRYHCIEAWRHAILLYICRVFSPYQDDRGMRKIENLAHNVLEHARCIPRTDFIQKQLLLPMFLAGSEVGDEWNRSFAREYCNHWNITSRFEHFKDTEGLLEEIWRDWTPSTR